MIIFKLMMILGCIGLFRALYMLALTFKMYELVKATYKTDADMGQWFLDFNVTDAVLNPKRWTLWTVKQWRQYLSNKGK